MKQQTKKKLNEGIREFIIYCRTKNLSERTIDYYEDCYNEFTKFYSCEHIINSIDKLKVQSYILYLKDNTKQNDVSVNTRLRGLRAILYYFMSVGYMEEFKISLIETDKKVKETYSESELKLLLKKPDTKKCDFTEYRNWVIVNTFVATGMRAGSLTGLEIRDIDFVNQLITLKKMKARRQAIIPMTNSLSKILKEYLTYRGGTNADFLFCTRFNGKMTLNALTHAIRQYNRGRGVNKTSIHLFRHTFAKMYILAGGDVFRLQGLLSHSSLDMVREYVNMFNSDLSNGYDRLNPLEQIQGNAKYIKMGRL